MPKSMMYCPLSSVKGDFELSLTHNLYYAIASGTMSIWKWPAPIAPRPASCPAPYRRQMEAWALARSFAEEVQALDTQLQN